MMKEALNTLPGEDSNSNEEELIEKHRGLVEKLQDIRSSRDVQKHPVLREEKAWFDQLLGKACIFPAKAEPTFKDRGFLRLGNWNVERGVAYEGIQKTLQNHPYLADFDVCLLTEVDDGMARSSNRHVTKELGEALGLHAVFGPAFLNLDKGNGFERLIAGENTWGLQGHGILSRYPIVDTKLIPLPDAEDHAAGEERQLGAETALVASIQSPQGLIHFVCVHFSLRSSRRHRIRQMDTILQKLDTLPGKVIIGGDWNTTTYNLDRAGSAILGFWRRVAMGIKNMVINHYPYPERYFERKLFAHIEDHDFQVEEFNIPGGCTVHYNILEPQVFQSLGDWVPTWCFSWIKWALSKLDGVVSLKLDWIVGREIHGRNARIIFDLPRGESRYSDHDPIMVDLYTEGMDS